MERPELLLPAGNEECLRAAVNNGADAVYLGLDKFNARRSAGNFDEENLSGVVDYCHKRNVKVYVALNILVKNSELEEYFRLMNAVNLSGADAVIIQDACFIPLIRKNFPKLRIHLSTQANNTNSVVPDADRIILARELNFKEIKKISSKVETEVFVHGALCFSYSGLCLFSSMAGGRSGNRGRCAQPCRQIYNNKHAISTMDMCMLSKIPELIKAGVSCFKIEGRMRSALYVQTAARIYRKAIDSYYDGNFKFSEEDIDKLKLTFNREFTTGFSENSSIVDSNKPMNRGLYIGNFKDGKLQLKKKLVKGDGIGIWKDDNVEGFTVNKIIHRGRMVNKAFPGDHVDIDYCSEGCPVYKTSSVDSNLQLGDKPRYKMAEKADEIKLPVFGEKKNDDKLKIFVKAYSKKQALEADSAEADVIYYDIFNKDFLEVKRLLKNSKLFASTPRVVSDDDIDKIRQRLDILRPEGVLVGNRALLDVEYKKHLDYSFNAFNDIDMACYDGVPMISPELNLSELKDIKDKNFISLVHGDVILMTTKEKMKYPELVDEEERHFRVRKNNTLLEILNFKQLGLFNDTRKLFDMGVKYFFIDANKEVGKLIGVYRKILTSDFKDSKIKKGYTSGQFKRKVE
ncbi:hypothetical protein GF336_03210 [Candidatus Woesearchaeota archaeon]|nr:hypothetical protein [Candidatus Woesearchaeota archaeon]